jgi:hypothetical protein
VPVAVFFSFWALPGGHFGYLEFLKRRVLIAWTVYAHEDPFFISVATTVVVGCNRLATAYDQS